MELAGKLPPISEKCEHYAYDNVFERRAVYNLRSRMVKCMCCGHVMKWEKPFLESFIDVDEYDCFECGRSMSIEEGAVHDSCSDRKFYTVLTTFKGYQVARTFEVARTNGRGLPTEYSSDEVFQVWLDDDGNETITGRPHHRGANYLTWDFHRPWEIKKHNASCTGYYQFDDLFNLTGVYFYPHTIVTSRLRRNGWDNQMMRYANFYSITDGMRYLLSIPDAEMLYKSGQLDLFMWMVRRGDKVLPYRHSVCIANRNGYTVSDAQIWIDYLDMASEIGMDTHNPKIVCPSNLTESHNEVMRRLARKHRQEEAEKMRSKSIKDELLYFKTKGRFLDICFGNENIRVNVIQSVADVAEEGKAMHHCVFDRRYYDKPDSLLLSARDGKGNRLETVELSLKSFRVLQSRGVCNKLTPFHEEIIRLVEDNADLFRRAV